MEGKLATQGMQGAAHLCTGTIWGAHSLTEKTNLQACSSLQEWDRARHTRFGCQERDNNWSELKAKEEASCKMHQVCSKARTCVHTRRTTSEDVRLQQEVEGGFQSADQRTVDQYHVLRTCDIQSALLRDPVYGITMHVLDAAERGITKKCEKPNRTPEPNPWTTQSPELSSTVPSNWKGLPKLSCTVLIGTLTNLHIQQHEYTMNIGTWAEQRSEPPLCLQSAAACAWCNLYMHNYDRLWPYGPKIQIIWILYHSADKNTAHVLNSCII
jgi:hypothetical protein